MKRLTFSTVSPMIVGKRGQHWPEYGSGERVFLLGLFRTEVAALKISPLSAQKYISGSAAFPKKLRSKYIAADGDMLLYANITKMISECPCVSHLIEVQNEVYTYICDCDISNKMYMRLASLYVPDHPTADEIARFLSAVLHAAILAS